MYYFAIKYRNGGSILLKKILACFLVAVAMFSLAACGETNSVFEEIEEIEAKLEFPEAKSDKYTLNGTYPYVIAQQDALLDAYVYNIQLTDIKLFEKEAAPDERVALISLLNKKRAELDEFAEEKFFANMEIILENVVNCEYREEYILEKKEDVEEFAPDYVRLLNIENEKPDIFDKMIQNYITHSNPYAANILRENKEAIIDKAIVMIEKNAQATESFQAYISLNNETVKGINYLFGGVGENVEFRQRINDSNYKLLEKTIEAMPDVTDEEKAMMLAQLRENQRLSDRSIQE